MLPNDSSRILLIFSGVARGSGWQHIGAFVNLGAFYLVAIPVALLLGFVLHMGGRGFVIGLTTGPTMQFVLLSLVTSLTDWQKQATIARERAIKGNFPADSDSIE
ncbi:hypothetical protein RHMOL_Rhmol10G0093400 [Rhododendron molle]|uniref:Uncharacterized protein n=1 Tax=Rhododendron molle TaxID=49168 RepID=A0ACC0M1M0_RHOML|nr:hypothetical protein RHMOL_Rhmol10G0093400 [Rhododendron molle]